MTTLMTHTGQLHYLNDKVNLRSGQLCSCINKQVTADWDDKQETCILNFLIFCPAVAAMHRCEAAFEQTVLHAAGPAS